MSMRREHWLLLVVVAVGAWFFSSFDDARSSRGVTIKPRKYEPPPDPRIVLAPALPSVGPIRDITLEPSESVPLPPCELPFPELERLPVVLPPLDPGQATGQFYQLRHVAVPVAHREFERASVAEAAAGGAADPEQVEDVRLYDQIVIEGLGPTPVILLCDDQKKYELARSTTITEPVRYHWISQSDGSILKRNQIAEPAKVIAVRLAQSIENRMGLKEYDLRGFGPAHAKDRKDFITELLEHAPQHPEFYGVAEQQAQLLIAQADRVEGYRWMQRILRAQGAIDREWGLYTGPEVPTDISDEFRFRGKGEIEAMLSLWNDAEDSLRRAAAIDEQGRSSAALADFLLARGRPREALEFAELAASKRGRINDAFDNFRVGVVHVRALLANGRVESAKSAVARLGARNGHAADAAFLEGAVAYAAGDFGGAAKHFTQAATDDTAPDARLGLGLCSIARGEWNDAYSSLMWVVENAPILRHRAHAALAVLYELTDNLDKAMASVDLALVAAPKDPYGLYLQGRLRRLAKNHDGAVESCRAALGQRDDLIEALAEIAAALFADAMAAREEDRAELLARAARYADRLVRLDAECGKARLYLELQGLIKFRLGEMAGAREAFDAAAARGSDLGLIGLGAIAYKQLRTAEARDGFVDLMNDPARPEETKAFARTLVDRIDDHSNKEQVRDTFDREELGELWAKNPSGRVGPQLDGDVVRFAGVPKATPAYIRREVEEAKHFLRSAVTMTIAPGTDLRFAGFELSLVARNRAQQNFVLRFGVHLGTDQRFAPLLYLKDGTRDDSEQSLVLDVDDFAGTSTHTIAIAARPGLKPNTFGLDLTWNDTVVHTFEEVRALRPSTSTPLAVDLVVEGRSGGSVDVAFDDFRLNRRRSH